MPCGCMCVRVGVQELEPSMVWSAMVIAGMGAPSDPTPLHRDMHTYLAGTAMHTSHAEWYPIHMIAVKWYTRVVALVLDDGVKRCTGLVG